MKYLLVVLAAVCAFFLQSNAEPTVAVPVELKTKHEEPVEHVSERFLQDSRWMLNGYNVKELNEDTYHTPNMVAGLMVGLTAVTIFFCGCCCLASVTTPREFADKPLNIAKEW